MDPIAERMSAIGAWLRASIDSRKFDINRSGACAWFVRAKKDAFLARDEARCMLVILAYNYEMERAFSCAKGYTYRTRIDGHMCLCTIMCITMDEANLLA